MTLILKRESCFIDGRWIAGDSWINVDNPANDQKIGRVPRLGVAHTQAAIEAAERALPEWATLTSAERASTLQRFYQLIIEHQDELAKILTEEQGKPIAEAKGEILYAASFIQWFAEEAKRVYGDIIPGDKRNKRLMVIRQPVGVVAVITPWNFPAAMITRKIGPALAAGCTVIIKPASQTPFTALALAALAEAAGFPSGVLNVVTGSAGEIGAELTSNNSVRKLSFTGSTKTGSKLYAQCAPTIKKLSLELGGNAPFLVFDDADLDAAVDGAIASKFRNAGQTCVCANRIYVQASVYDQFISKLISKVKNLRVGNGLEQDIDIGPLINQDAVAKVEEHIQDALSKGAQLKLGGQRHQLGGNFFQPTVISDVTEHMKMTAEETFGPVAPIIRFETEAEAVAAANATPFGLAAYFYARDISRIWRVAEAIEAGMIGINTGLISTEVAPFGGIKQSGLGREGSRYGMDEYVEMKYLSLEI